jgi:hypothetical protein
MSDTVISEFLRLPLAKQIGVSYTCNHDYKTEPTY